jgi:Kef-type K+ transport system membrane component KefB
MSLTDAEVTHLLVALSLLLVAAHTGGYLFGLLRQPPVVGEILGGLVLGPTVLGLLAPGAERWIFGSDGASAGALGAAYQLGLLLLMFMVGTELELRAAPRERRTVATVTAIGLLVPFAVGLLTAKLLDPDAFIGPKGTPTAFALIFGLAIAVTSIPVISRIMMDLGLLDTAFARIVLSVAVLDDVALYVVLAVVLGIAQAGGGDAHGLPALIDGGSTALRTTYFVVVSLIFLACALVAGGRIVRHLVKVRYNPIEQRNPTAFRLLVLFGTALICLALGINSIFGALVAGVACRTADSTPREPAAVADSNAWASLKQFSLAFFIPLYFAVVGLRLDLIHDMDILFTCWFLVLACAAKAASVWAGARLAGQDRSSATGLAIALNARGGPGIVLATVTFGAHLINEKLFTTLILLSIITSEIAGYWLDRTFVRRPGRRNAPLSRQEEKTRS